MPFVKDVPVMTCAMVCDASRSSKSQENGPFHRTVWQGLIMASMGCTGMGGGWGGHRTTPSSLLGEKIILLFNGSPFSLQNNKADSSPTLSRTLSPNMVVFQMPKKYRLEEEERW